MLPREVLKNLNFAGKEVALFGLGLENLMIAHYLFKQGAHLRLVDQQDAARLEEKLKKLSNITYKSFFGKKWQKGLLDAEIVFVAPGVPSNLAIFLKLKKKALILEPIELLLNRTKATTIAVTGTKGKSTTVSLIYHLLKTAGKKVYLAGNIGSFDFERLINLRKGSFIVLELSSFQLEKIHTSPKVSVVLPVTADHLAPLSKTNPNFHPSLTAYRKAKKRILAFQDRNDLAVLSADSPVVRSWAKTAKGQVIYFSSSKIYLRPGVYVDDGFFVSRLNKNVQRLASVKSFKLFGKHNLANAAAAIAVAKYFGVKRKDIIKGLESFVGLPHRLQKVAEDEKRIYIDDSLATNPSATIAAIQTFANQPTCLILGGSSKGADFSQLAREIKESQVKVIALIGSERERLFRVLRKAGVQALLYKAENLKKAVTYCQQNLKEGIVLLSPACASLDQFASAYERGEVFQRLVKDETA